MLSALTAYWGSYSFWVSYLLAAISYIFWDYFLTNIKDKDNMLHHGYSFSTSILFKQIIPVNTLSSAWSCILWSDLLCLFGRSTSLALRSVRKLLSWASVSLFPFLSIQTSFFVDCSLLSSGCSFLAPVLATEIYQIALSLLYNCLLAAMSPREKLSIVGIFISVFCALVLLNLNIWPTNYSLKSSYLSNSIFISSV